MPELAATCPTTERHHARARSNLARDRETPAEQRAMDGLVGAINLKEARAWERSRAATQTKH